VRVRPGTISLPLTPSRRGRENLGVGVIHLRVTLSTEPGQVWGPDTHTVYAAHVEAEAWHYMFYESNAALEIQLHSARRTGLNA